MGRASRLSVGAYAVAAAVVALDQALKFWVLYVYRLAERATPTIIGPMHLTMVWNRAVSFGFLNFGGDWGRWVFSAFALTVAAGLAVYAWRVDRPLMAGALGLIMGGAIGNVIDRLRYGAVIDYLDFSRLHFPWVFNLADSTISVGVALIVWDGLFAPRRTVPG